MKPAMLLRNLTPTSTWVLSFSDGLVGVWADVQIEV